MKLATYSNAIVTVVSAYAEALAELAAENELLRKRLAEAHDEIARVQMKASSAAGNTAKR